MLCLQQIVHVYAAIQFCMLCKCNMAVLKDDNLSQVTPFLCVFDRTPAKQYMKNHGLFMQHKNNLETGH